MTDTTTKPRDRGFYLNVKGQRGGNLLEGALGTDKIPVRGPWAIPKDTGVSGAQMVYHLDIAALNDDQIRSLAFVVARGLPLSVDQIISMIKIHGMPILAEDAEIVYTRDPGETMDVDDDFMELAKPYHGFNNVILEAACEVLTRADTMMSMSDLLGATGVLLERRRDGSQTADVMCGNPSCPIHGDKSEDSPEQQRGGVSRTPVEFVKPDPALR
jgi:hypothetical protein